MVAEGIDDGVDIGFERTIDAAPEYLHFFLDRVTPVTGEKSTARGAIPDILNLMPYIKVPAARTLRRRVRKKKVRRAICRTRSSGSMAMMFKAGPALVET